ncbi:Uncharacterised protein [Mycobacterium tuberculosis]|nr:Uncharacterised protein [Mycobacterium tuberculosis]
MYGFGAPPTTPASPPTSEATAATAATGLRNKPNPDSASVWVFSE